MKKRFLSALLALSMIFSVAPIMPVAEATWDKSNVCAGASFKVNASGQVTDLSVTFGDNIDKSSPVYVIVAVDNNEDAREAEIEDFKDQIDGERGDVGGVPYFVYKMEQGQAGTVNMGSYFQYSLGNFSSTGYETGNEELTLDIFKEYLEGDEYDADAGLPIVFMVYADGNDTTKTTTSTMKIKVGEANDITVDENGVATVDNGGGGGGGDTATELTYTTTGMPSAGATIADSIFGISADSGSASLSVTWEGGASGEFQPGQNYTATLTASPGSGTTFDGSITADVSALETAFGSSNVSPTDATHVTVTIKIPQIEIENVVITGLNDTYTAGDTTPTLAVGTVTPPEPTVTKVTQTGSVATAGSQTFTITLEIASADQTGYKFTSSTTANSNLNGWSVVSNTATQLVAKKTVTVNAATTPITALNITADAPVVGGTPSNSASTTDSTYSILSDVEWIDDSTNTTATTFEYGKSYTLNVPVQADSSHTFAANPTVTFNTTETGGWDADATVATWTVNMPSVPTISSVTGYDYFDNNDVEITFSDAIVGYTGLQVHGQSVSGTLSGDKKKITIDKDDFKTVVEAVKNSGNTLVAPFAEENWTVSLVLDGNGTTPTTFTTQKVKNTTPYVKITSDSLNMTAGGTAASTTVIPVTKGSVALAVTDSDTGHLKQVNWTNSGAGTLGSSTNKNNTITLTDGQVAEIKAEFEYYTKSELVVTKTGNGSYTVNNGTSDITTNGTADHYDIWADETYTITATAVDQNYVSTFTGADAAVDLSSKPKTATGTIATPAANKSVTLAFTARTAPTLTPATQSYAQQGTGYASVTRGPMVTLNDYLGGVTSISATTGAPAISPTSSTTDGQAFTITAAAMEAANPGTYTYTFNFQEGYTLNYTLTITGTVTVTSVSNPTGPFAHGDDFNLTGFSFVVNDNGTAKTYTYNGTSWTESYGATTNTNFDMDAAGYTFDLSGGSSVSTANQSWSAFKTWAESKKTRHDTRLSTTINTGAQITVTSPSGKTATSSALSVGTKEITVTPSKTTAINKVYDGTTDVEQITGTIATGLVDDDNLTVNANGFPNAAYASADAGTRAVVFGTPAVTSTNSAAGNYTFAAIADGTGVISPRPIRISTLWTDKHAQQGVAAFLSAKTDGAATLTANSATTTLASHSGTNNDINHVITLENDTANGKYLPVENLSITYSYKYSTVTTGDSVDANVEISDLACSNSNYDVKFDNGTATKAGQHGYIEKRTIQSISATISKDTYYYTDNLADVSIEVTYSDDPTNPVTYTYSTSGASSIPSNIEVKWDSASGAAVTPNGALNVPDHNNKKLYIYDKDDTSKYNNSITITVNPIPVTVDITGSVTKTYDKQTTVDITGTTVGGVTLASSMDSSYTAAVTAAGLTASYIASAKGTFSNADASTVTNRAVSIAANQLTLTSGASPAVDVANFALTPDSHVTGTINKAKVTVTAIKNIPSIREGAAVTTGTQTAISTTGASGQDIEASGIISGDSVNIGYSYDYVSSAWSTVTNSTTGEKNTVKITAVNMPTNTNYELAAYTDGTGTSVAPHTTTGTGTIAKRDLSSITIGSDGTPTQFKNSQSTAIVYNGTSNKIDLTGLKVTLSFTSGGVADGTDTYVYNPTNDSWDMTSTASGVSAQTGIATADVPFTLSSEGSTTNVHTNGADIVYAMNGGKIKATATVDTSKTGVSTQLVVAKRPITLTVSNGIGVNKVYDNSRNATGTFTFSNTIGGDGLGTGDTASDVFDSAETITGTYDNKNAGTGKTITFSVAAFNGTKAGNYNITIANGSGAITQKTLTVTRVGYIPAITQFGSYTAGNQTISSAANSKDPTAKTPYVLYSGLADGDTVSFYVSGITYTTPNVASTAADGDDAPVTATIALTTASSTNYTLDTTSIQYTGTVNEVKATDITITSTFTSKEYGDWLDMDGFAVKVGYGGNPNNPTHETTYTYTASTSTWSDGTNTVAYADLPFTLDWGSYSFGTPTTAGHTVETNTKHNSVLAGVGTATVKATLKANEYAAGNVVKTSDTEDQTVTARKVTVTPTASGTLTKVYDGTTNYTWNNNITYTVAAVTAGTLDSSITLPTVSNATVTYDSVNATANTDAAAHATKVTVAATPTLSDATNFVVDGYTATDLNAEITKRPLTLTEITNVPDVQQYASDYASAHPGSAVSPTQAKFDTFDTTNNKGLYTSDVVGVTYSYAYDKNTDTATPMTATANITGITFDTAHAAANNNYNLTVAGNTQTVNIVSRTESLIATLPSQLSSGNAKYNDTLDLTGLTVAVYYDGALDKTYTAAQDGTGAVTWNDGSNAVAAADLPFTLEWNEATKNGVAAGDIRLTDNSANKLSVPAHNGNKIKAVSKNSNTVTALTAEAKVNPIEITAITAALGAGASIDKTYDGTLAVETADAANITYSSTNVLAADAANVVISATPKYTYKDVYQNTSNPIVFENPTLTDDYNGNYALAPAAAVSTSTIKGTITKKAVTVEYVYAESVPAQTSATDPVVKTVTNAHVGTTMLTNYKSASSGTVKLANGTDFASGEASHYTFRYTVTYAESVLNQLANKAVSVTVTPNETMTDNDANYPLSNYSISYQIAADQQGYVLANEPSSFTVSPPVAAQSNYTHGDKLNLAGLSITVNYTNSSSSTYTVVADGAGYKWDTPLAGVSVKIGDVDITSDAALSGNAHHTNMNGKAITVTVDGLSDSKTGGTLTVAQRELTPVITVGDATKLTKTYDGNADVDTNANITVAVKETIPTFGGTPDDVGFSATYAYEDKDVNYTGGAVGDKMINIAPTLTGTDSGNYKIAAAYEGGTGTTVTSNQLTGKIDQFSIDVEKINNATFTATRNDASTKTNATPIATTDYTIDAAASSAATLPDANPSITYNYEFDKVTDITTTEKVTVTPVTGVLTDTNYKVIGSAYDTNTGVVQGKTISGIEITTQPKVGTADYGAGQNVYGDTADLSGMKVTVTYSDTTTEVVDYNSPAWTSLDLKIADDSGIKAGDTLYAAGANNSNGKTVKVSDATGTNTDESDPFVVLTRRVNVTSTATPAVTREWTDDTDTTVDTTSATGTTITAAIDGTQPNEGLLAADAAATLEGTPVYAYADGAVGTNKTLTYTTGLTLSLNNGQYTIIANNLQGDITPKTIKVTVIPTNLKVNQYSLATGDLTVFPMPASVNQSAATSGGSLSFDPNETTLTLPSDIKFKATVKIGADQHKTKGTYTLTAAADTDSDGVSDAATTSGTAYSTYEWTVEGNNGNYTFEWQDAVVTVEEDKITNFSIKTPPTAMTSEKTYGDTLSFEGLVVTMKTKSGDEYDVPWSDQDAWTAAGLSTPYIVGGVSTVATDPKNGYSKLKTADNGKKIGVTCSQLNNVQRQTSQTLTVNKKPITINLSATDISKTYDAQTALTADNLTTLEGGLSVSDSTSLVTGDTVSSWGTLSGNYYLADGTTATKNHHKDATNAGAEKAKLDTITPVIMDGTTNVTNEYDITQPNAITGTINPLAVNVTVGAVPPIGHNTDPAADKTVNIDPIYSQNPYESTVSVTLTGTYESIATVSDNVQVDIEKTENGNDYGNYTFSFSDTPKTGRVINPSIGAIKVLAAPELEYTHGDNPFDLATLSLEVTTVDSAGGGQTVVMTRQADGSWTVGQDATTHENFKFGGVENITTFADDAAMKDALDMKFYIVKDATETEITPGLKLRRDRDDGGTFVVKGGSVTATNNVTTNVTVNQATISGANAVYADGKTAADITKVYDGDTTIAQQSYIVYNINPAADVKFRQPSDAVTDDVKITPISGQSPAQYANKNAEYTGATPADKTITVDSSKLELTGNDADNYKLADNLNVTVNVAGQITKKDLNIAINSVPPKFLGSDPTVNLTSSNFTATGFVNGEDSNTIGLTITATYSSTATVGTNIGVTYAQSHDSAKDTEYNNYNITLTGTPDGTVTNYPVTSITITALPENRYVHLDSLDLTGMTVELTYQITDTATEVHTYVHDGANWTEGGNPATPAFALSWTGTTNAAGPSNSISLADTGTTGASAKNLQGTLDSDSSKLTTSITATSTIASTTAGGAPVSVASDAATGGLGANGKISVGKRPLTLTVAGDVTKVYDGTDAYNHSGAGTKANFTLANAMGGDVSVDETATAENIKFAGKDVDDTVIATVVQPLTVGTIVLKGDDKDYYIVPAGDDVTNNTTGEIKARKIKVTKVNNDLDVSLGSDKYRVLTNLEEAASDEAATGYVITADNAPTTDTDFWPIVDNDVVKLNLPYYYNVTSMDEENESAPVVFGTYTAPGAATPTKFTWDNTNYDVTLALNQTAAITNGEVASITLTGPDKNEYTHGEQIDFKGAVVTVTYAGNSDLNPRFERYTYDDNTGRWDLVRNNVAQPAHDGTLPNTIKFTLGAPTNGSDKIDVTAPDPIATPPTTILLIDDVNGEDVLGTEGKQLYVSYDKGDVHLNTAPTDEQTIVAEPIEVTLDVGNYVDGGAIETGYEIEKNYDGTNAVSADDFKKLHITDNLADMIYDDVYDDTDRVAILPAYEAKPTLTSLFAVTEPSAVFKEGKNVKLDGTGNVIDQPIELADGSYTIMKTDVNPAVASKHYKLKVVNNAVGKIVPKEIDVEVRVPNVGINSSAAITKANLAIVDTKPATDADKALGYVYSDGLVAADLGSITAAYNLKYANTSVAGDVTGEDKFNFTDGAKLSIDGDTDGVKNYKPHAVTYLGAVTGITNIVIKTQPTDAEYKSGEDLDPTDLVVTITSGGQDIDVPYSTDPDSQWQKLGLEIVGTDKNGDPIDDTTPLKVKNNDDQGKQHFAVKAGDVSTAAGDTIDVTIEKRPINVVIDRDLTPDLDKQYDGKSDVTQTVTLKLDPPAGTTYPADVTAGTIAPADFKYVDAEDNDAKGASNTAYTVKPLAVPTFTDADLNSEYELVYTGTDTGKIDKRTLAVTIKDAGIKSTAGADVSRTGIGYSDTTANGKYTIAGIDDATKALIAADGVTIKYTGKYPEPVTVGTDEVVTLTTAEVEGDNADNYQLVDPTATGDVTKAAAGGGGGGGGGSTNSLTIHYENEDGTAGDDVSKIEAPLGTEPANLIGVIKTKIKDMTVLWSSDNEKVATVDENGIVTFVGEGTATITAVSKQTKSLKDTVLIEVAAKAEPDATPEPTEKPDDSDSERKHERVRDSLITKTMLNPYIVGYDDYVFGPELPISREELSAIFARLIANNLYMDQDYDTSFPDVPEKWSKSYIGYLEGFNVVTGYEDGNFRPENYITRAEMAVMMAKAEGYDITPDISADEVDFPDVDDGYATWSAAKAIQILSDLGIMSGYTDGTFRPGQPITRAETVATVNRVLAAQEVASYDVLPSDVTDAHWAYNDIVFAMNHRILKDASADPNAFIWSEEFDKNMVTITEKGESTTEVVTEDETSGEDAVVPEATEAPSDSEQTTTN